MIFAASWAISARIYHVVQRFAPSNIIIRRVHTRAGIKWGPLVGLAGVLAYGLLLVVAGTLIREGVSGWLSLLVLVGFWNMVRFSVLIPASVIRLLRVRHQEKLALRDWQRTQLVHAPGAGADGHDASVPVAQAS